MHRQIHKPNKIDLFYYNGGFGTFKQATHEILKNNQIPKILGAILEKARFQFAGGRDQEDNQVGNGFDKT